jgi:citrate lyase subunit beta / citryl-CoA lyase
VNRPSSYLFVPADRPERLAKALASGAGAVIVDLEDAVAPAAKAAAREALLDGLARHGAQAAPMPTPVPAPVPVLVRINAAGTEPFQADLAALRRAPPGAVQGLVVPKAESAAMLEHIHHGSGGLPILPLIETATGFDRVKLITRAAGVQRLVFGSIDFQLDCGIEEGDDGTELLFVRSQLVLASRLARLAAPVDGVTPTLDDPARVEREARPGARRVPAERGRHRLGRARAARRAGGRRRGRGGGREDRRQAGGAAGGADPADGPLRPPAVWRALRRTPSSSP